MAATLLVVMALLAAPAASLRALMVFPFGAHSHNTMFRGMAEALVDHGHEVVMFSPFPRKTPRANYTDIDTTNPDDRSNLVGSLDLDELIEPPFHIPVLWSILMSYFAVEYLYGMGGDHLCRHVFAMPEMQSALTGGYGKFDVVLTEAFASDCWAAIAHHLQLPLISLSSAPDCPSIHEPLGSIDNPSYLVNIYTNIREPMTFWERVENTVKTLSINYFLRRFMQDGSDATVRQYFGDGVPPLRLLVKNTSLVLMNRHVGINVARPVTPNIVHVGGLHILGPPNTLDPDLRKWMDGAEHGVIYFSLGSMVRGSSMSVRMRDDLLWAFKRLPQRVLWKWETSDIILPNNVRVSKWLPQMDVLTHNNTILFITHGGLMGTLEALHCGVPMLGMPLFADQVANMDMYGQRGVALTLDRFTMTKESILEALLEMTKDKT